MTIKDALHEALSEHFGLSEYCRNVLIILILRELQRYGYTIVRDPTKASSGEKRPA